MPQPQPHLNNLHQLIAELGEKLDLTSQEIADVLWLALKRQEIAENLRQEQLNFKPDFFKSVFPRNRQRLIDIWKNLISQDKKVDETDSNDPDTTKLPFPTPHQSQKAPIYTSQSFPQTQGLPIRIPDAPSLREPLNLAQSLYPLMRRVPTGNKTILDEVATVELVASENISLPVNIYFPVLKSEPEPWLDLALVIDESQSMLIWRHTVEELQHLLKNYGIFRDLRVWGIKPDKEGNTLQIFSRMGSNHRLSDPKEIIDPTGRRLILVVSDCVSNLWRKGIIFPVLHDWTQKQPLAVIQLLPEWMWQRSALNLGTAVGFSSSTAGVANRDLLVNKKFLWEERIKIPVLTLEPEPAAQWSKMLIGKADAAVPGYLLPTQLNIAKHPLLKRQQEALSSLDSQQRVERFRLNTSPHRLSKHTKQHYRLPSEAEWEYACRAGTTTPFHFGETITLELANYNGYYTYASAPKGESRKQTTPVGIFNVANAFGLYDMHGNVSEWCVDHWHGGYEGAPKDGSAWIDISENDNQKRRMLRDGSWAGNPRQCRSASRGNTPYPAFMSNSVGFRVVVSAART